MRRIGILVAILAVLSFVPVAESFAQGGMMMWKGGGGWGMNSPYGKMYDPKTVVTISGDVERVDMIAPMRGMSHGVHLQVNTGKETVTVHLGPTWYLENQDVKIIEKDKLTIKGSKVTLNGKTAIIAAEVKKGEEVLKLRDESGIPVWSGWRRR